MWWSVPAILGLAALSGQKEALLLLIIWIAWPLLRQVIQNLRDNSRREERKEDIEVVEGEIVYPEPLERVRGELPHSTRPALPDPDVVEVEFKELPPPSTPKWQYVLYAIGLLSFIVGILVLIASVLSVFR